MTDDEFRWATDPEANLERPGPDIEIELEGVHVDLDDAPDELLVIPPNASNADLMECWIQASSESFVSLDDVR